MPAGVASRIRSRLTDERRVLDGSDGPADPAGAAPPAEDSDPAIARPRWRRAARLVAAAAVVATLAALPVLARPADGPVPVAMATTPDALRHAAAGATAVRGTERAGWAEWAAACLAAAGAADPAEPVLASRPYPVAGESAVLLVLATSDPQRRRLVVVPADCHPGRARVLAETRTG